MLNNKQNYFLYILLIAIGLITGFIIQNRMDNFYTGNEDIEIVTNGVLALSSTTLAIYTIFLFQINKKTRHENLSANIIVSPELNENVFSFIDLSIHNIGNGIAKNIKIKINSSIKGLFITENKEERIDNLGIIKDGIPILKGNQKIKTLLANAYDVKDFDNFKFTVNVSWIDYKGKKHEADQIINISHFSGITDQRGHEVGHLKSIAESLKKIEQKTKL